MHMDENQYPVMFGIWIPGKGWIRGANAQALMFMHKHVAQATAKLLHSHARVQFIDQSLVDIEQQLLDAEMQRRSLWQLLLGSFGKKTVRS